MNRLEEIKERISLSTFVFYNYAPIDRTALEQISKAGIHKIELLESPQQFDMSDINSMHHLFDICQSTGISIISYHSQFVNPTGIESETELAKLTDICKRQIDTLQEAGGNFWASHARIADRSVYKLYEELLRFVEGTHMTLGIENFTRSGMWVQDRMDFIHRINHPQLGILLDIGHVRDTDGKNPMTYPCGPEQILHLCGNKLFHVHLHGFKKGVDHFPPLCNGDEIQWNEIFTTLRDTKYQGYFNFEPMGLPKHKDTLSRVSGMPEAIARIFNER